MCKFAACQINYTHGSNSKTLYLGELQNQHLQQQSCDYSIRKAPIKSGVESSLRREQNGVIVIVISNICAFPIATNQNVCCKKTKPIPFFTARPLHLRGWKLLKTRKDLNRPCTFTQVFSFTLRDSTAVQLDVGRRRAGIYLRSPCTNKNDKGDGCKKKENGRVRETNSEHTWSTGIIM